MSERIPNSFCASPQSPVLSSSQVQSKGTLLIIVLYFKAMEEKNGTHDNPISEGFQLVTHGTWHLQNFLHAIQYNQLLRHVVKNC